MRRSHWAPSLLPSALDVLHGSERDSVAARASQDDRDDGRDEGRDDGRDAERDAGVELGLAGDAEASSAARISSVILFSTMSRGDMELLPEGGTCRLSAFVGRDPPLPVWKSESNKAHSEMLATKKLNTHAICTSSHT